MRHEVSLTVSDTIGACWEVDGEKDAVAVTRAVKPLWELVRSTKACVILVHHSRNIEGEHGDEKRGSGAQFGLLGTALIPKRHKAKEQRLLRVISRFPEAPSEVVIELREHGLEAIGDPAQVAKRDREAQVLAALSDMP
jgi:hypothetical protein